jgi:uncharacterized protein YcnI
MRTVRKTVVILAAVAGVLALATPAFAHEEINPKQFPTGTPTFFSLSAANEKNVDLTKLTLTAPSGVHFGEATRSPAGWSANRTDTAITWSGGAVKPANFEQWGYEIEGADQPGTLTYKVTLGFSDGSSDDVNVQTTAVAGGATATTVAGGTAVATTAAPAATTATTEAKSGGGSAARTRANVALVLGAVALVAAIIALVLAARKRNGSGGSTPASTGGGQKQDW